MSRVIIGREFPDFLIDKIKKSKSEIKILIYDWRWYDNEAGSRIQKFNQEIIKARQRGVKIQAIVNSNFISDKFQEQKIDIKKINSKKVMHVKMVMIDNKDVFLGSHNLTKNAFELNHEISVLISEAESIDRCNHFFKMAWAL